LCNICARFTPDACVTSANPTQMLRAPAAQQGMLDHSVSPSVNSPIWTIHLHVVEFLVSTAPERWQQLRLIDRSRIFLFSWNLFNFVVALMKSWRRNLTLLDRSEQWLGLTMIGALSGYCL
jgi:hypothetical protein